MFIGTVNFLKYPGNHANYPTILLAHTAIDCVFNLNNSMHVKKPHENLASFPWNSGTIHVSPPISKTAILLYVQTTTRILGRKNKHQTKEVNLECTSVKKINWMHVCPWFIAQFLLLWAANYHWPSQVNSEILVRIKTRNEPYLTKCQKSFTPKEIFCRRKSLL